MRLLIPVQYSAKVKNSALSNNRLDSTIYVISLSYSLYFYPSTMFDISSLPSNIRRATLADVTRLAVVGTAGFYGSPLFQWDRVHHHTYPLDTYLSNANTYATRIQDPGALVLVAEDEYDEREGEKSSATIATDDQYSPPKSGEKAPVGVAVWTLPETSKRRGTFTPSYTESELATVAQYDGGPGRDVDPPRRQQLRSEGKALTEKHFAPAETVCWMMTLVVHPAYQGKGHGRALASIGAELADADGMRIGLIAQPRAVRLYKGSGFETLEFLTMTDGQDSVDGSVMVRRPKKHAA